MKVGDLVKFKHDSELMLITYEQRPGVYDGVFVTGPRPGRSCTSHESLMEKVSGVA